MAEAGRAWAENKPEAGWKLREAHRFTWSPHSGPEPQLSKKHARNTRYDMFWYAPPMERCHCCYNVLRLGCLACPEMHAALRRSSTITWIRWAILDPPQIAGGEEHGSEPGRNGCVRDARMADDPAKPMLSTRSGSAKCASHDQGRPTGEPSGSWDKPMRHSIRSGLVLECVIQWRQAIEGLVYWVFLYVRYRVEKPRRCLPERT